MLTNHGVIQGCNGLAVAYAKHQIVVSRDCARL